MGVRVKRGSHGRRGNIQGGCRGNGPGEGVGVAGRGREGRGGGCEDLRDGRVDGAEDLREGLKQDAVHVAFGKARGVVERRHGDGEGAGSDFGWRRPGIGGGEEDGAPEEELHVFEGAGFADGDAGATGKLAEGGGDGRGDGADVVEGEEPVLAGEGEEFAGGGGHDGEG